MEIDVAVSHHDRDGHRQLPSLFQSSRISPVPIPRRTAASASARLRRRSASRRRAASSPAPMTSTRTLPRLNADQRANLQARLLPAASEPLSRECVRLTWTAPLATVQAGIPMARENASRSRRRRLRLGILGVLVGPMLREVKACARLRPRPSAARERGLIPRRSSNSASVLLAPFKSTNA